MRTSVRKSRINSRGGRTDIAALLPILSARQRRTAPPWCAWSENQHDFAATAPHGDATHCGAPEARHMRSDGRDRRRRVGAHQLKRCTSTARELADAGQQTDGNRLVSARCAQAAPAQRRMWRIAVTMQCVVQEVRGKRHEARGSDELAHAGGAALGRCECDHEKMAVRTWTGSQLNY